MKKTQCHPCIKGGSHKITSRFQALNNNPIDKIQISQLCTMMENLTATIQSFQKIKFEVLNGSSLALKNPAIPLLPITPPNKQRHKLPNSKDPTLPLTLTWITEFSTFMCSTDLFGINYGLLLCDELELFVVLCFYLIVWLSSGSLGFSSCKLQACSWTQCFLDNIWPLNTSIWQLELSFTLELWSLEPTHALFVMRDCPCGIGWRSL